MPHTHVGWASIFPRKKGRLPKVPNKYWPDIGVELYFKIFSMKKLDLSELKVNQKSETATRITSHSGRVESKAKSN
jgi:hypothetical protein